MYKKLFQIVMMNCVVVSLLAGGGVITAVGQVLPPINDPSPGSTLTKTTVTFTGGVANQAGEQHWLSVETSPFANDIFHQSLGTGNAATVGGLPASGTLFVRYHTYTPVAGWDSQSHTYTMNVSGGNTSGSHTIGAVLAQIAILNDKLDDLLGKDDVDLRGVAQNWDKKLDSTNGDAHGCNSDRFSCMWQTADLPDGAAVRDNETGLVWERNPIAPQQNWRDAILYCGAQEVAGRKGWHLPMKEQLASLVDESNQNPTLPTNHPFMNVHNETYHTATVSQEWDPPRTWAVQMNNGAVFPTIRKTSNVFVYTWCVRGGQSYDGQDVKEVLDVLP